jgi:Spirocyclase AveC-like
MVDVTERSAIHADHSSPALRRSARPVLWWAALGLLAIAFQAYVYTRWVSSDDFHSVPTGPDAVPNDIKIKAVVLQCVFATNVVLATAWVVRGCVKRRKFTFDAKIFLGCIGIIWMDHAANLVRPQMFMNSYYINRGSWDRFIPGWISRNPQKLPASIFVELGAYFFLVVVIAAACNLLVRLQRRQPRLGFVGIVGCAWVCMAAFVFTIETLVVHRLGWNAHLGAPTATTLFAGKPYAEPLTEVVIWAGTLTALVVLRFQHVTAGTTVVERGLDRVGTSARWRTVISTLAVVGYATMAMAVYAFATAVAGIYGAQVSDELPSYISNGICGRAAGVACPGPDVPVLLPHTPVTAANLPRASGR